MFFAPFPLMFTWLVGLLSLALLGGGVYILFAWYVGWLVGTSSIQQAAMSRTRCRLTPKFDYRGRMGRASMSSGTDPQKHQLWC